jgi:hypothetical protein
LEATPNNSWVFFSPEEGKAGNNGELG